MKRNDNVEVEADIWLKSLTEFTKETIRGNDSKILQMTYDRKGSDDRRAILTSYTKEANRLIALKRPTLEEKKTMLLGFVEMLKRRFPEEFAKVGWYDFKVAKEKKEKEAWLALPVDNGLIELAKKEGRISFIVHK